ncbi:oligosaccharide flippase family protein [Thiopseudomonas alkaliphila]|uniref:lipopolysaccharide biosynthesis protein n=1 Tax=Thiopseudomonas alkaliphila TaxID=1697053 RepID=UPI0035709F1F
MTPKQIAAFAIGPIGAAAISFITLPVITWFFSQEDVGRMSMLTVAISFSTLLFTLGLDQAYVREFHESKNKPALFKQVVLPGLFLLSITLLVLLSLDNTISFGLFGLDNTKISWLVAIAILSDFLSRFFSLILRMQEKGMAYSLSQLLPKLILLSIISGYALFDADREFDNLLTAIVVSALSVCVIFAWNTRSTWLKGLRESFDYQYLKSLLSFGFPLIFGGLAFWGLTATDKIFLKELSSYEQLGLYSVSVSFAAAASIFQAIFSTVWAPTVYKWAATGEGLENIHKVTRYVLLAVIVLFSLAALFSWVVPYLLPENYKDVQWILIPCLGYPLLYTLSETTVVGLGITRRSGLSMLAASIAFVINLIGNWFLVPEYGAKGAAISTCIAFWFFFFLRTEFAIYAWKPIPRLMLYCYTSAAVCMAIFSCLYSVEFYIYHVLGWFVLLVSTIFYFKLEFFVLIKTITKGFSF